VTALRVGFT